MFWFKKKKQNIYKIIWHYYGYPDYPSTDYVRGKDEWDAWRKLKKEHIWCDLNCKYIEKIELKEE